MQDALKWIEEGFYQELQSIARDDRIQEPLATLSDADATELGRRGAREALAPVLWGVVTGDVFDTSQASELLGVTRQAINKRVRNRSLLALPGRGTTYFPVWQFDLEQRTVRPVTKEVLDAFFDAVDGIDPFQVASWSSSPQYEELEGMTPQEWIHKGGDENALRIAARRAAAALAA